ncbi:MAG: cytidylate kinase-like family protein [Eubacterium sp.]|nr:cytidylate kinase-like family protein [Eubacterium sp.]
MNTVITISREIGSGGHAIGELVAEKLGIPFLDRDFINEICKETGMDQKLVEAQDESGSWSNKYFNTNFYNALYMGDPQDSIFMAQRDIIMEHAKKGPCVIVGRCADFILREAGIKCLNVFIYADKEIRAKTLKVRDENITNEKMLAKKDKGRRFYYKYYTDQTFGDAKNYHMSIDSGFFGIEKSADLIIGALKKVDE